jgi:hypothetical protein
MFFEGSKNIVLISPEPWDGFKVSKHHYAEELGRIGHRVLFVEPPNREGLKAALEVRETETPGVSVISYQTWFPYKLKFHARALFDLCMRRQAHFIREAIGMPIDVVWDMDITYNFVDLRVLGAGFNIFHPVDPDDNIARFGNKGADLVLTVAQAIVDPLGAGLRNAYVVPHGLGRHYEVFGRSIIEFPLPIASSLRPRVAYVGNLDRDDIDWPIILEMASQRPDIEFWLIGPHHRARCNSAFAAIVGRENCRLPGLMNSKQILELAPTIDVWLACYDPGKSVRAGMNSHKVLEYLATGRSVLSNRFDALAWTDLVAMPESFSNQILPQLLTEMLADREANNAPVRQRNRAIHALQFTYAAHLHKINNLIRATRDVRAGKMQRL